MKKPASWGVVLLLVHASIAAAGDIDAAEEIAARFAVLAGTESNARILVTALQAGKESQLTSAGVDKCDGAVTVKFPAAPRPLARDEVIAVLLRAQDALALAGITHPSSPELQSALFGGTVPGADGRRIELAGVLEKR